MKKQPVIQKISKPPKKEKHRVIVDKRLIPPPWPDTGQQTRALRPHGRLSTSAFTATCRHLGRLSREQPPQTLVHHRYLAGRASLSRRSPPGSDRREAGSLTGGRQLTTGHRGSAEGDDDPARPGDAGES